MYWQYCVNFIVQCEETRLPPTDTLTNWGADYRRPSDPPTDKQRTQQLEYHLASLAGWLMNDSRSIDLYGTHYSHTYMCLICMKVFLPVCWTVCMHIPGDLCVL